MDRTVVRDRENALVSGRWGSSSTVAEYAVEWYERAGARPSDVLNRTLHPIGHYSALLFHENDCDDLLPPTAVTAQLGLRSGTDHLSEWSFSGSLHDSALRAIIEERLDNTCAIVAPSSSQVAMFHEAFNLLGNALPALSADALSYVARLVLTDDQERIGETMRDLPTVVLLGPAAFTDAKALAEAVFHEALHTKTAIIERSAMLMREDKYERDEVIRIPWRNDDDDPIWPVSRAFLAYYVYAHLSVLWAAFWEADHTRRDLDQFRRVCFRAAYLSKQLQIQPQSSSGLGAARYAVIRWLDALRVPAFDLTPKAAELIHLNRDEGNAALIKTDHRWYG